MGLAREGSTLMTRFVLFLSPPRCLPLSQGQTENGQSRGWQNEAKPTEKAVLVVRKVGLQADDRPGAFEAGGSITSSPPPPPSGLLSQASRCSSALRDTAPQWKAEVVLPLPTWL